MPMAELEHPGLSTACADEQAKMRITDRAVLASCMEFLRHRGFTPDDMTMLLVRHFYVDLDELREAMRSAA